mmetsp:Transcript_18626/g.46230  ORF Transcript_18626/g.46230 Transcript_18626/m.46230 type:complete len:113 (+) Transcript_18626:1536-1874(+)
MISAAKEAIILVTQWYKVKPQEQESRLLHMLLPTRREKNKGVGNEQHDEGYHGASTLQIWRRAMFVPYGKRSFETRHAAIYLLLPVAGTAMKRMITSGVMITSQSQNRNTIL